MTSCSTRVCRRTGESTGKGTVTEDEAMSNFYKYINEKYPTIVTP